VKSLLFLDKHYSLLGVVAHKPKIFFDRKY